MIKPDKTAGQFREEKFPLGFHFEVEKEGGLKVSMIYLSQR